MIRGRAASQIIATDSPCSVAPGFTDCVETPVLPCTHRREEGDFSAFCPRPFRLLTSAHTGQPVFTAQPNHPGRTSGQTTDQRMGGQLGFLQIRNAFRFRTVPTYHATMNESQPLVGVL